MVPIVALRSNAVSVGELPAFCRQNGNVHPMSLQFRSFGARTEIAMFKRKRLFLDPWNLLWVAVWQLTLFASVAVAQPHVFVLEAPFDSPQDFLATISSEGDILDSVVIEGSGPGVGGALSMKTDGEFLLIRSGNEIVQLALDGSIHNRLGPSSSFNSVTWFDLAAENRLVVSGGSGLAMLDSDGYFGWSVPRGNRKGVAVGNSSVYSARLDTRTIERYSIDGQLLGSTEIPNYQFPGALAYDDVSNVLYMAEQQGEIVAFDASGDELEFLHVFDSGLRAVLDLEVDHFSGNLLVSTAFGFGEFTNSGEQQLFHPVISTLAATPARNIAAPSDLDGNRDLDVSDLDILVQSIANDLYSDELDINNDGELSAEDLDAWLEHASFLDQVTYQPGDIDLDGFVDVHDFNLWNEHKFTSSAKWSEGDLNADGLIDTEDFNIWSEHKFDGGVNVVPEPQGIVQSLWLILLLVYRKRTNRRL